MDLGGSDDAGGLEDAFGEDQAGIMQYLEEVIGEDFDAEFLEEIRNSGLFADVMRECGVPVAPGSSNHSTTSRRPSLNESERDNVREGNQNFGNGPQDEASPSVVTSSVTIDQRNTGTGQSKPKGSTPTKKNKKRSDELDLYADSANAPFNEEDFEGRSSLTKKEQKLKIRPLISASVPEVSSSKIDKKEKGPSKQQEKPGPKSKTHTSVQQPPSFVNHVPSTIPHETDKQKRIESSAILSPSKLTGNGTQGKKSLSPVPVVYLTDLVWIPNAFPSGLSKTIHVTAKLLEEIRQCENKMRLSYSCAKSKSKPLLGTASRDREKNKFRKAPIAEVLLSDSKRPNTENQARTCPNSKLLPTSTSTRDEKITSDMNNFVKDGRNKEENMSNPKEESSSKENKILDRERGNARQSSSPQKNLVGVPISEVIPNPLEKKKSENEGHLNDKTVNEGLPKETEPKKKLMAMPFDKLAILNETLNKAKSGKHPAEKVKKPSEADKKSCSTLTTDMAQMGIEIADTHDASTQALSTNSDGKKQRPPSPAATETRDYSPQIMLDAETDVIPQLKSSREIIEEEHETSSKQQKEQVRTDENLSLEEPSEVVGDEVTKTSPLPLKMLQAETIATTITSTDVVLDGSTEKPVETETIQPEVNSSLKDAEVDDGKIEVTENAATVVELFDNKSIADKIGSGEVTGDLETGASHSSDIVDVEDAGQDASPINIESSSLPPSPGADDSREPSSPEIIGVKKSPTPERTVTKKKNVIESSSDDGDHRREDTDLTDDTTPERKKCSDDEPDGKKGVRFSLHNPSIERKRDQDDTRSGKFGEFEMERQRKKDKKKGSRDKSGKVDLLEDFLRDKQLSGSFRIPKKSITTNRKNEARTVVTPLTSIDVPKENMQFERFRKGLSDKDKIEKKERGEWNNRNRSGDFSNEFRASGDQKFGNNRMVKEPGTFDKHKLRDEGRVVLLAPEEDGRQDEETGNISEKGEPETEPLWANDGEDPGSEENSPDNADIGDTVNSKIEEEGQTEKPDSENVDESLQTGKLEHLTDDVTNEKEKDENEDSTFPLDPEVPLKKVEVNPFSIGAMMLLQETPNPELPDVEEEKNLAEVTMIKVAWWISKAEFETSKDVGSRDDWYKIVDDRDSDDDGASSDCSFHELLRFTQSEEEEVYRSLPRDKRRTMSSGPSDELCGRQLLVSEYRSGPDTFSKIFQLRGSGELQYVKENFQARCTLCDFLVVGRNQLASHVLSDSHKEKMSKAGLDNLKISEVTAVEKNAEKVQEEKNSEALEKNGDICKGTGDELVSVDKEKKNDDRKNSDKDKKKREEKHKEKRSGDKKRKRSRDRSSSEKSRDETGAEVGVTSTGLPIKIPAGAIPDKDKKRSEAKEKRSGSRSPRHKRNRSRSPRHHGGRDRSPRRRTKSRSPHCRSSSRRRRSRSRSRDRGRDRAREPVVRIARSPTKVRRRSTSAERVEKFLAKTQRRSRSPSNGYRKRHRPASPLPTTSLLPKKTNKEFHEKMALTLEGKWTEELENKWKIMEAEEAIFMEQFGEKSKALKTTPESHPKYGEEWTAFWERRYQEIEEEGKEDPDKHNYVPEWKEFWTKRLRELLDNEYEEGIKDIKIRNGVDIETLQKLRNLPTETTTPQIIAEPVAIQPIPVPQPVPPPSGIGVSVPTPQACLPPVASIAGTITPSSKSVSDVEDMTARPMSISDGGDDQTGSKKSSAKFGPPPNVTTVDVMSTWEKLKSGGLQTKQSSTEAITASPAQQTLRSLSSTKSAEEKSIPDSTASIESYTFSSGMDVVQVLYHMSKLEDQLSFFAGRVQEYFKKAEEMDLQQRNKSYLLLTDEEFVALLFQIRDRFMAMIRAHILPKDVLDKLNLTVYGLNGILDHPDCKKRRPKVPESPEIPPPRRDTEPPKSSTVSDTFTRPSAATSASSKNPFRNLSEGKKQEIATLLTSFILSMGREDMSDTELKELMSKICQTPSPVAQSGSTRTRNSLPATPARVTEISNNSDRESDSSMRSVQFGEMANLDPWRLQNQSFTRTCSVASVRGAGTAVPELPNVLRYNPNSSVDVGPIRFDGEVGGDGISWGRGRTLPGNDRDNYLSSSSSSTGRHSPFSRRDYTGNTISSNPFRDKDSCIPATVGKHQTSQGLDKQKRIDGGVHMPVVTVGTSSKLLDVKMKSRDLKNEAEIQMNQLTKYREVRQGVRNMKAVPDVDIDGGRPVEEELALHMRMEERRYNRKSVDDPVSRKESFEGEVSVESDKPKLPPGILNMIMKERDLKLKQKAEEVLSDELSEVYYYKRRKKKRKRKKGKIKQRSSSTSSSEDSDGNRYAQDRSRERRRRREKRSRQNKRSSTESPVQIGRERNKARKSSSPNARTEIRRSGSYKRSRSRSKSIGCSLPERKRERVRRDISPHIDDRRRRRSSVQVRSSSRTSDGSNRQRRRKSSRQRSSYSGEILSESGKSDIILDKIIRKAPPRAYENVEHDENYSNENEESPLLQEIETGLGSAVELGTRRRVSPRERHQSTDEMHSSWKHRYDFRMDVPPPSMYVNSKSRKQERQKITTVIVPTRSKLMPKVESWDTLSEISSLGEDKNKVSKNEGKSIFTEKEKVTSVSKTFWTEMNEDAKSLCSISSHEVQPATDVINNDDTNQVPGTEVAKSQPQPVNIPRNYRKSFEADEEKEPGELSSSSAGLDEI